MPLDVAAEPGLFTPFLCHVVLLSLGDEAMGAGMLRWLLSFLVRSSGVQLLQNLVAGFFAVSAFGVILRTLLMAVAVLHQSPVF